jgi:predicted nucleic acid-binding protein
MRLPQRIFLDTNVFVIGFALPQSAEGEILDWVGLGQEMPGEIEVIMSDELLEQIRRVAKRLRGKEWGGELIGRLWKDLNISYVSLPDYTADQYPNLPREDIGMYLTAQIGRAQYFVSANHELIRSLAAQTGEFECLKPAEFVVRLQTHE